MRTTLGFLLVLLVVLVTAMGCFSSSKRRGTNTNDGTGSNDGPWSQGGPTIAVTDPGR